MISLLYWVGKIRQYVKERTVLLQVTCWVGSTPINNHLTEVTTSSDLRGGSSTPNVWWRHQMETFFALLALCAGNLPVTGEFPAQKPATPSFNVFFDLRLNEWLSKQSWGWWFETPSRPLWRHYDGQSRTTPPQVYSLRGREGWWPISQSQLSWRNMCKIVAWIDQYDYNYSKENCHHYELIHSVIYAGSITPHLTHWGRDEIAAISQMTFCKCIFVNENV